MFRTPQGTHDILPDDWPYWDYVYAHAADVAWEYGYRRIETPTFGDTALFARTSGAGSDIVSKEMYTFQDRDGDSLTLRPEGTAPVVRAYLQHGMHKLPQPVKLFYFERMYRAESPQAGRFREHHQFGCEAIGTEDAYVDVEMIDLLRVLYGRLGLRDFTIQINTIGDANCRPAYIDRLVEYLRAHEDRLAPLDRDRLERNPLRVLDSKEAASQEVIERAPHMIDYLCDACAEHWRKLRHGLERLGAGFTVNHRLVRGLDYYTRTVFEFVPSGAEGAQSVLGAGGRYDALAAALGAPDTPGVGFGSGIERIILALKEGGISPPQRKPIDIYIAHRGEEAEDAALALAGRLRRDGRAVLIGFGGRSLKAQMRQANTSGARFAAIIGDDELASRTVQLRRMSDGEQWAVSMEDLSRELR